MQKSWVTAAHYSTAAAPLASRCRRGGCGWHHSHLDCIQLLVHLLNQIIIRQGNTGELLVQLFLQRDRVDKGGNIAGSFDRKYGRTFKLISSALVRAS